MTARREREAVGLSNRSQNSLSLSEIDRIRDPLMVYSLHDNRKEVLRYNPALPPSRFSLLEFYNNDELKNRKLRKTTKEIEAITEEKEDIDVKRSLVDERFKLKLIQSFVEKNRSKLWQIDFKSYYNKSPKEICQIILEKPNFMKEFQNLKYSIQKLNLNSSEQLKKSLYDEHLHAKHEINHDVFILDKTIPRNDRIKYMETILQPALYQHEKSYKRGANHTVEYGNFSRFTGYLNLNKSTMLNR